MININELGDTEGDENHVPPKIARDYICSDL